MIVSLNSLCKGELEKCFSGRECVYVCVIYVCIYVCVCVCLLWWQTAAAL